MGLFFTLLYILTAYLSPAELFGSLAELHIQVILSALALLTSLPRFSGSGLLREPQTLAIGGMSFAVAVSLALTGWLGAAPTGLMVFIPNAIVYFLVLLNCRSLPRLRMLVFVLFFVCSFVIVQGMIALRADDIHSLYLYDQSYGGPVHVLRLRGLSFIADPNDFGQVLVSVIPLMFFFRRKGAALLNVLFVYLPVGFLLYGVYLTHSRGAIVAMVAVCALALRRKVGTVTSVIAAGLLLAVAAGSGLAGGGGREMSMESGSDRMDAWYMGLQLIRSHPLFGVGFEKFGDFYYITAHNTVVVCAAEIGLIGFFFWVLFVLSGFRTALAVADEGQEHLFLEGMEPSAALRHAGTGPTVAALHSGPIVSKRPMALAGVGAAGQAAADTWARKGRGAAVALAASGEPPDVAESARYASLMVLTLAGYLTAGWFLSRAYVMTLFLFAGMVQVLERCAREGDVSLTPPLPKLLKQTAITAVLLLLAVLIILHVRGLAGG